MKLKKNVRRLNPFTLSCKVTGELPRSRPYNADISAARKVEPPPLKPLIWNLLSNVHRLAAAMHACYQLAYLSPYEVAPYTGQIPIAGMRSPVK
jgi:hypothetical protein